MFLPTFFMQKGVIYLKKIKKNKEVNVTKIKGEMEVKNYKVFCELVGEKVQSGSAKKQQLEKWARFIQFERIPHTQGYHIIKVYDTPMEKPRDRRSAREVRGGIYKRYMEYLLMQTVLNSATCSVRTSRKNFLLIIGLFPTTWDAVLKEAQQQVKDWKDTQHECNVKRAVLEQALEELQSQWQGEFQIEYDLRAAEQQEQMSYFKIVHQEMVNYLTGQGDEQAIAIMEEISPLNVGIFIDRVENKARSILKAALTSMVKDDLVTITESFNVTRKRDDGKGNETMTAGIYIDEKGHKYDENQLIRDSMEHILKSMHFSNLSDARLSHKLGDVYEAMTEELSEKYGILKVYNQTRITAKVEDYENPDFKDKDLTEIIKELNQKFVNGLYRQTISQHERAVAEMPKEEGVKVERYKKERAEEHYVDHQTFMIDHFLKLTEKEIKDLADEINHGVNVYDADESYGGYYTYA